MINNGDGAVSAEYHKMIECPEEIGFTFHPPYFIGRSLRASVYVFYDHVGLTDCFVHGIPDVCGEVVNGGPCATAHGMGDVAAECDFHLIACSGEVVVPRHIGMERKIGICICKEGPGLQAVGENVVNCEVLIR